MIIKLTVNNNDYSEILCDFASKIKRINLQDSLIKEDTKEFYEKYFELSTLNEDMKDLIYCNNKTNLSNEEKENLIKYIKDLFVHFISKKEHKDYLIDNLKVEITNSLLDGFENGEYIYYFPSNDKFIEQ